MDNALDDKAIVEAVLPDVIKSRRRTSRDDVVQVVWVALLVARSLSGNVVENTKRIAKELLQRERDRLSEILRRVEFDENALAFPRYNDDGVDVSSVVLSMFRKLDKRDNEIFRRRYLRGEKLRKIAYDLDLSQSSVSRRCNFVAQVFVREYNRAIQRS